MKKWLLALMICLSFSTLTAGLFLLPQTINAVYQREQEENDQESQGSAATRHYEWSSTTAVRTISLQMNGKTATNSRTTTVYANSLYDVWLIDDSGLIYQSFSDEQNGDEDAPTHANGPVLPDTSLGNMVHIAKTSLTNTTSRTITNWNNDKKITVPTVTGYNFLGYYSSSSGGTQYINASGQVQSAGENSISYGATGTGYWYAHWEAAATPISLGLYAYFNDADGNNQSGWVAGLSVQHSTNNSSWSNCSQTGSGYSYDYVGYNYDVYQGYYLRFKINCESGYATWKITNSSGTRVWPSGDGYYYAGIYSSSTSYNVYPVAGYQVSFYAQSNGTVQHQTSSPKMSSISAGAKSGQAISVSGANYWTTSVYNTYFDIYARANSGYTFSYWSPSTTGTLTAARTVYAYFDRPKYQITLNVNGATSGSNQTVYGRYMYSSLYANSTVSNTTTATISSPYKSNCYFAGWTKTQDGTDYVINSSGQLVANTAYTNSSRQWTYQGSVTLYAKFYFSVTVHFTMQGPGEIVEDEACRYGYDTSSDELEIYFDEWDDMQVYWYGSDQITIEIHGGAGGLFTLTTDYYFTGELDYDFDDSSGSYEMPDDGSDYFYIAADDTIYNDIWIYFYTYKYATIGRNNTSYGTISQSRVEIPGTSTYSITSSGSTVTINGVSVTATPASSTTGFTYAFGSWTIPSDYASSSFPTITANFTRSINTRSVTLATRIISKAGNVGSSNAIPSGASLGVSYTNGSANATSSTQSGASTAYTIQAGTNMTITVTTPAGYKYIGYNISTSKPTVNSFPTSSTLTAPSAGTYYFFFEEIAAPLYYTTERGGYWYYEDGKYPQTYVGTSLSGASASNQTFYLNWKTGENTSYNSYGNYKVYTVGNSKYIYVESPMSGTIKFNGQTVTLASGTKYWFRIDPIRWRVSKYGASASEYALGSTTSNLVGVSDILGYGRVNTNASITDTQNMTNAYQDCSAVGYTNASTNIWRDMYTYQEGNSTKVNIHIAEVTQASKMLVASPDSLNATGDIRSYASDLSAMLECRDYNNSTGWTSGMYNISSGIVVGPGASYTGKYWANTDNVFGFVYAHQASYATCLGGSNGLAAGYTIVEYIQSNGGQFINTGVKNLSGNFSIEVKYNKTNTDTSDQCLFGQRQFGKFANIYGGYYETAFGGTSSGTESGDSAIHTIISDSTSGFYKDGTKLISGTLSGASSSYPALMFAFSEDGPTNAKWFYKGRIYYCKVYENGCLIRNFVPVLRNLDGTYGMYDSVTQMFYGNDGTGVFTGGEDIYSSMNYIQSTGSQYINTGYKITTTDFRVELGCGFNVGQDGLSLFGSNSGTYDLVPYHADGYGTNVYKHWVGGSSGILSVTYNYGRNDVNYRVSNGTLYCDINGIMSSVAYSGTANSNQNFYIFGKNGYGSSAERANGYILYYLRLYDGANLVRDFIPAKNTSGTLGMYDAVTGTFYTNSGSGSFTGG